MRHVSQSQQVWTFSWHISCCCWCWQASLPNLPLTSLSSVSTICFFPSHFFLCCGWRFAFSHFYLSRYEHFCGIFCAASSACGIHTQSSFVSSSYRWVSIHHNWVSNESVSMYVYIYPVIGSNTINNSWISFINLERNVLLSRDWKSDVIQNLEFFSQNIWIS